jgi:hypothetical protein
MSWAILAIPSDKPARWSGSGRYDTFYSTDLDRLVASRKGVSFPVLRSGSSS